MKQSENRHTIILTILLIALLAVQLSVFTSALPSEEDQYITVVGADAPTTDVITAANYAATIKAYGVTFTGVTDEDLLTYFTKEDLEDKFFVVIDQDEVALVGDSEVTQETETYFEDQGFDVELQKDISFEYLMVTAEYEAAENADDRYDSSRKQLQEESETESSEKNGDYQGAEPADDSDKADSTQKPVTIKACNGCNYDGGCYSLGDMVPIDGELQYCDGKTFVERKSEGESCSNDYECGTSLFCEENTCISTQKKSFFGRIFSWFGGLFS